MNIEDKIWLAEWMGWRTGLDEMIFHMLYKDNFREPTRLKYWNPDTSHEQFKEVRKKLTDEQWAMVNLLCTDSKNRLMEDVVLFELPKIMEAVLTVLKESEK